MRNKYKADNYCGLIDPTNMASPIAQVISPNTDAVSVLQRSLTISLTKHVYCYGS